MYRTIDYKIKKSEDARGSANEVSRYHLPLPRPVEEFAEKERKAEIAEKWSKPGEHQTATYWG